MNSKLKIVLCSLALVAGNFLQGAAAVYGTFANEYMEVYFPFASREQSLYSDIGNQEDYWQRLGYEKFVTLSGRAGVEKIFWRKTVPGYAGMIDQVGGHSFEAASSADQSGKVLGQNAAAASAAVSGLANDFLYAGNAAVGAMTSGIKSAAGTVASGAKSAVGFAGSCAQGTYGFGRSFVVGACEFGSSALTGTGKLIRSGVVGSCKLGKSGVDAIAHSKPVVLTDHAYNYVNPIRDHDAQVAAAVLNIELGNVEPIRDFLRNNRATDRTRTNLLLYKVAAYWLLKDTVDRENTRLQANFGAVSESLKASQGQFTGDQIAANFPHISPHFQWNNGRGFQLPLSNDALLARTEIHRLILQDAIECNPVATAAHDFGLSVRRHVPEIVAVAGTAAVIAGLATGRTAPGVKDKAADLIGKLIKRS